MSFLPMSSSAVRATERFGIALRRRLPNTDRNPAGFSGIYPSVLAHFAPELSSYGLVAVSGGAGKAQPDDANIVPGDMVSVMLVSAI